MTRKTLTAGVTFQPIRDKSITLGRVEPTLVQEALGADASAEELAKALAPISLFAVREELVKRLQSSGGRPALAGVTRRAKIPLSDEEWLKLEELAAAVSAPGFAPSAGQVASVLLTLSLQAIVSHVSGKQIPPLLHQLAAKVAATSDPRAR